MPAWFGSPLAWLLLLLLLSHTVFTASTVPVILIFGGTDVNEYVKDERSLEVMSLVVARAS